MKTRKNQQGYRLPPFGEILHATVRDGMGPHYRLLYLKEYQENPPAPAMPRYFTLDGSKILLWPTPDKGYELTVRFYPPAQEV